MSSLPDWDFDFKHGTKEGWEQGDYQLAKLEDFDKLRAFADSTEGWSSAVDKSSLKVWDKTAKDSPINLLKVWAKIPGVPAATLYDVLHDPDYRKTWDDNMEEGTLLTQLDPHNDVGYYRAKSPFFGISGRDFVNTRCWYVNPDKTEYIIMNHSVPHEDRPEKKGYVRAISYLTGYIVRVDPDNTNDCILLYVTQSDPKGWIPAWAMNKATKSFAPKLIEKMGKVALTYDEWKSKNNPDQKIWLSKEPYNWEKGEKEKKEKSDSSH